MKKSMILGLATALALGGGVAFSQDRRTDETRRTDTSGRGDTISDEQFVKELGHANQAEIKLGKLARHRGDSEQVKEFGRHMIEDHTKASDELSQIAKEKGWKVPVDPNDEQKATYDRLDKLSGAEFDREFVSVMNKDHKKVVDLVERYSKDGKDAQLKGFASKILPTLQHHLDMAKDLEKKIGR